MLHICFPFLPMNHRSLEVFFKSRFLLFLNTCAGVFKKYRAYTATIIFTVWAHNSSKITSSLFGYHFFNI